MEEVGLAAAIERLRAGRLVVFTTETVYGLGADAGQDSAVAAIYTAKQRPSFNPLIVHVGSIDQAQTLAQWNNRAEKLAEVFWPGPLTLVLPRLAKSGLSEIVSACSPTVAIRCPGPTQARELAAALPQGIAAPSANPSGQLSPTRAEHVWEAFGQQSDMAFLSGDDPEVGLESTVIDISGPKAAILRAGGVSKAQIETVIGEVGLNEAYLEDFSDEQVSSPGQLRRHYAPRVPLLFNQIQAGPGQALLAFGPDAPAAEWVFNLSERGDLVEAAARLFAGLHVLGGSGANAICAMPIPNEGIGVAINDRLRRGAVPLS